MKYHTRTKWDDGAITVSESSFKSIKEAAEHVVSEGDSDAGIGGSWVCQLFELAETESGFVTDAIDRTPEFTSACYEYWLDKYDANYCDYIIKIIEDLVDERFMFDGEVYVIRKGME